MLWTECVARECWFVERVCWLLEGMLEERQQAAAEREREREAGGSGWCLLQLVREREGTCLLMREVTCLQHREGTCLLHPPQQPLASGCHLPSRN